MLHVVLLVFFLFFLICGIETFNIAVDPPVKFVRVNDTFEISCFVADIGGKLDFYDGDDIVSESFIKRINDSYIVYKNACSKPEKKNITCKKASNIIGMSEIYIDGKFGPAVDFKCRTRDLKKLSCTFVKPFNYHPITYRLHYTTNDLKNNNNCKLKGDFKGGYSCNITVNSNPLESIYNFTLRGHNDFYKRKEHFQVKLMETLLPGKLEDVLVSVPRQNEFRESQNVVITFELPRILENVTQEMMFHIKLKPKEVETWEDVYLSNYEVNNLQQKFLTLLNVKFANTLYHFKVRMKSKLAEDSNEMWSTFVNGTFKTHPKLPEMLPLACESCYSIVDNGHIYIYWTEVPKFYQNGDKFSYVLKIFDPNTKVILNETITTKTSYMLPNNINLTRVHIRIYSSNHIGLSKNFTSILVYTRQYKSLLRIRKEWIDNGDGYKLSWRPHESVTDVESYTITWCRQKNELANQCDSPIRFTVLPSNKHEFYLNTSHSHQLGIAMKTINGISRGIQWAKCTSSRPDEIGSTKTMWVKNVNENSILLEWSINCADKDIVSAYHIHYCVVAKYDGISCLEEPRYEIFNATGEEQRSNRYQITNLKPYQVYKISVLLLSTSGRLGAPSKPLVMRTLEGSPSTPYNLIATDIQSNNIEIQWTRPIEANGPSLTYQLWYNGKMIHIDSDDALNDTIMYNLKYLQSFTNYTITIVACTRKCSQPSESLILKTRIGAPSQMNQIVEKRFLNGSIKLSWQRPNHVGGYLSHYLLIVNEQSAFETRSLFYKIDSNRNSCMITSLNCDKNKIAFSISGVNEKSIKLNPKNTLFNDSENCFHYEGEYDDEKFYYGDMSPPFLHTCVFFFENTLAAFLIIILAIILMGIFVSVSYKIYLKLQDMKDIQILLPTGLMSNIKFDTDSRDSVSSFDLVEGCKHLSKIKEESFNELELYEKDLNDVKLPAITEIQTIANDEIAEHSIPLILKSKSFTTVRKSQEEDNKVNFSSVPSSPLGNAVNQPVDYVKMYQPCMKSLKNVSNPSIGYMDMSGKSSDPQINQNDIKVFIRNSHLNNGYIPRKSVNNSSGYVGFRN